MFILEPQNFTYFDDKRIVPFVHYWENLENNKTPDYLKELNLNSDLTEKNVIELLKWKDPRMLTHPLKKNQQTNPRVERVLDQLSSINDFRANRISKQSFQETTNRIFPNGIIWQIFLFHIARPTIWPIADQHVFRAYSKLKNKPAPDSFLGFRDYIQFFDKLTERFTQSLDSMDQTDLQFVKSRKRIDNALFAYGKFLSKYDSQRDLESSVSRVDKDINLTDR